MYGTMIRITARSTARLNCSAMVGDMLANNTSVISTDTMMRPVCGTPCLLSLPNTLGNMPSSAAALADWPTSRIQPPTEPTDFDAAQMLITMAASPLTFQLALKMSGWNQNQPSSATATMGISASAMVQVSSRPTTRGPRMFAKVSTQITMTVTRVLAGGASMCGISSAR